VKKFLIKKVRQKMKMTFAGIAALVTLGLATSANAQSKAPENWFNLDPSENSVNGVSTEKMYSQLLKGKQGQTVIVAVIDGGVDPEHEDLKDIMWTNPREIPNNGIDDDKNGYIDDIHGWNFLGGKDGRSVHHETLEKVRVYGAQRAKFANVDVAKLSKADKKAYEEFSKMKTEIEDELKEAKENLEQYEMTKTVIMNGLDAVEAALDGKPITKANLDAIDAKDNKMLNAGKGILLKRVAAKKDVSKFVDIKEEFAEQLQEAIDYFGGKSKQYDPDFNPRADIVKDNYADSYEKNYGNNDVKGPEAMHGTHVAGIIGGIRTNNKGMKGVADNVRIMAIRCVPDGDERDKDVANSIIYAVDNGAQVINMSFGKSFSWDKAAVDKAVKYAQSKDVLLVHAAGNDAKDNDDKANSNFPKANFEKAGWFSPKKAKNWIEVGALSWKKDDDVVATFSNYGQGNVDLFAPGVDIYSTTPDGKYKNLSGTSMASPVTAGVAAVIRSYYPDLTAEQVKECLEKSVVKQNYKVKKPGSEDKVPFSSLSRTGGVVNVFEAVKLAGQMKGKKKATPRA
jgi:cell wall-associated protease